MGGGGRVDGCGGWVGGRCVQGERQAWADERVGRLLPAEPDARRVLHPPPRPPGLGPAVLQGPAGATACWCQCSMLAAGCRGCGGAGVLVRGGEPARPRVAVLPRPPGCPAAPPCGRLGDGSCLTPARRASRPRLPQRTQTASWLSATPGGPRLRCPGSYKMCLNPSPSAAPASPPAPVPRRSPAGRPPLQVTYRADLITGRSVAPPIHVKVLTPAPQNVA